MSQKLYGSNAKYRRRMSAVVFDEDVIEETDRLRGKVSRSRYVNDALRQYNKRTAIINQKIAEFEKEMIENNEPIPAFGERDIKNT